jgi:iron complex outermembrane receptor protein
MTKWKFLAGGAAAAIAFAMTGTALAQSKPVEPASVPGQSVSSESSQPADTALSQSNAADIIVTARKRAERQQDVPVAISAFGGPELARYATGSVADVAAQVPQLVISQPAGPGGGNINLRGVGSATTSPAVDQQVSLNLDGVQASQSNLIALGVYDLARVEVLKGPQALFFGKNSPGGVISLISADPGNSLEWSLRSAYDFNQDGVVTEGVISTPLTDKLGIRVAGAYSDQNGWFRNTPNSIPGQTFSALRSKDAHEYFGRVTLKWGETADRFNAKLKVAYNRQDRNNGIYSNLQLFSCPQGAPQYTQFVPGASTDCRLDRNYSEPDMGAAAAAESPVFRDGRPYFDSRLLLSSFAANYRVSDDITLTSVTGYYDIKEKWATNYNQGGVTLVDTGSVLHQDQFTQELRLGSSFSTPLNFVVGAFYQSANLNLRIPTGLGSFFSPTHAPLLIDDSQFHLDTETWSAFGQLIWAFAPRWELAGGARYSHERKAEAGRSLLLNGAYSFIKPVRSFENVSPEATLSFKPNRNLNIYGAYRQGFTSGGFNLVPLSFAPGVPVDNGYRQATVRGGEFGIKGSVARRQVQFDLDLYRYTYRNLQLSALDPTTIALSIRNAASSRVQGAEASVNIRPDQIKALSLRSTLAYNDAYFTSFPTAQCYQGQTVAQGCNGTIVGGIARTQDLSGAQQERAPKWTINYGATVDQPLAGGLRISVSGDANYTGRFFAQPEHDPRSIQRDAWRFNANITLSGRNDGWSLAVIGKNLTNVLRAEYAFSQPFTGGGTGTSVGLPSDLVGSVGLPRTVVLQLTVRNSLFR